MFMNSYIEPIVKSYYDEIMELLKKEAKQNPMHGKLDEDYLGSEKKNLDLSNAQRRKIAKNWYNAHAKITDQQIVQLFDMLATQGYDAKAIVGMLMKAYKRLRNVVDIFSYDTWLESAEGWAEVDILCQSIYSADEVLVNWKQWNKLLSKLNNSANAAKQRGSLVLLVRPVREVDDERLFDLSFENIKNLIPNHDKLITKAISWLLRSMSKTNSQEVETFLDKQEENLPAIAVRETWNKIKTGTK
jgi:3-methyladenine DNA glycosylase AlkD